MSIYLSSIASNVISGATGATGPKANSLISITTHAGPVVYANVVYGFVNVLNNSGSTTGVPAVQT